MVLIGPGLLLVDKPIGPSSAQVVDVVKRACGISKVGHGGTLDPFASGLLPVLIGREFTRDADTLLAGDKAYRLTMRLGCETDTGDLTGVVVARGDRALPGLDEIAAATLPFVGEIDQEPPVYSALKHEGKPLYWYARRGQTVTKAARRVTLHSIDVIERVGPDVVIDVRCGKGAYMRALAQDLGRALGCLGHLVALRRTQVGPHRIEDATPLWRISTNIPRFAR